MPGNLQTYALIFASMNGTLLAEEHQVTLRRSSASQRVMTVAKGLAGLSPGSPITEFTVSNAIPQGGFEFDMGKNILGLIPVSFQFLVGGIVSAKGTCFIEHDSIQHGVNREANYDFEGVAPFSLFT
jgi:hypothetical protein